MRVGVLLVATWVVACGGDDPREVDLQCDPEAQDCVADEKCVPFGPPPVGPWEGTTCVEANAAGSAAGTPCFNGPDFTDTCDADTMCLNLDTGEGYCTAFCTAAPDSCAATERCVRYDDALGLQLCALRCELDSEDCPLAYACVDTAAGPACVPWAYQDRVPQ